MDGFMNLAKQVSPPFSPPHSISPLIFVFPLLLSVTGLLCLSEISKRWRWQTCRSKTRLQFKREPLHESTISSWIGRRSIRNHGFIFSQLWEQTRSTRWVTFPSSQDKYWWEWDKTGGMFDSQQAIQQAQSHGGSSQDSGLFSQASTLPPFPPSPPLSPPTNLQFFEYPFLIKCRSSIPQTHRVKPTQMI